MKEFVQVYDERYERQYGFWRPVIAEVIEKYLDCGDLTHGFAHIRCDYCGHEYLLPFSGKGRYFGGMQQIFIPISMGLSPRVVLMRMASSILCRGSIRKKWRFFDPPETIEKILKHLDLWQPQAHSPPNYFHLLLSTHDPGITTKHESS